MTASEVDALLQGIAADLDRLAAPWRLIGSAALIRLGVPMQEAADLDVVTAVEGAGRLRRAWADWLAPGQASPPDGPFRSLDFARYETPWGAVEILGGLHVGGELLVVDAEGPIPSAAEQLRILRLFGRPKDLAKAAVLEAWLAAG